VAVQRAGLVGCMYALSFLSSCMNLATQLQKISGLLRIRHLSKALVLIRSRLQLPTDISGRDGILPYNCCFPSFEHYSGSYDTASYSHQDPKLI